MTTGLVALLHLCDSLFPIGAFSHSDGLEAAVAEGSITNRATLAEWTDVVLTESLGRIDGPAVSRSWRAHRDADWSLLAVLDEELHALTKGSPMKRAKLTGLRRNLAVAIGNSRKADAVSALVEDAADKPSTADSIVGEHVTWAVEKNRESQKAKVKSQR